jgi:hypothetical protein
LLLDDDTLDLPQQSFRFGQRQAHVLGTLYALAQRGDLDNLLVPVSTDGNQLKSITQRVRGRLHAVVWRGRLLRWRCGRLIPGGGRRPGRAHGG